MMSPRLSSSVLALALLCASAAPAAAQRGPGKAPAPPAGQAPSGPLELKDRVVAVVDEDPILASEIERAISLGLVEPREGESETALRRRVLEELIDQRLRFHRIDRYGFEQVPVDLIERHVAEIRSRFPSDEAFRQALRELGLSESALRQLVARQLLVMTHVEEQLGPRVFVSLDDISKHYREVLTPQMRKLGQEPPPLEEVRDDIRTVLKEQRLNEELDKWTNELRREADVQVYFDRPPPNLPPVVKKIP